MEKFIQHLTENSEPGSHFHFQVTGKESDKVKLLVQKLKVKDNDDTDKFEPDGKPISFVLCLPAEKTSTESLSESKRTDNAWKLLNRHEDDKAKRSTYALVVGTKGVLVQTVIELLNQDGNLKSITVSTEYLTGIKLLENESEEGVVNTLY